MTTLQVTRQSDGEIIVNINVNVNVDINTVSFNVIMLLLIVIIVGYMHQHHNENIWMKVDQILQCHMYHQSDETKCPI